MNYSTLIIVLALGIIVGYLITKQNRKPTSEQTKKKQENKDKVLVFVQENGKVRNNDVEKMLGVSDATAERYLDELEKEGKLEQQGLTGHDVFYTLK